VRWGKNEVYFFCVLYGLRNNEMGGLWEGLQLPIMASLETLFNADKMVISFSLQFQE